MTGDNSKETEKEQGQQSFSKVVNEQNPPTTAKPQGMPLDHSEFFRKPSEMASFTLQPSILVPYSKGTDKPKVTNFTSIINSHRVGTEEKDTPQEKKKRTRRTGAVSQKEPKKKRNTRRGDRDRLMEINDSKVKKKIKAHQFDSEAEDVGEWLPLEVDFTEELCFLEKEHVPQMSKKISKGNKKVYDLLRFVKERDSETRDVKTYACKYCPKVFVKRAALGGHTAKNHPHQSDSYRLRQESLKNRRIERERFDYFKNIKK